MKQFCIALLFVLTSSMQAQTLEQAADVDSVMLARARQLRTALQTDKGSLQSSVYVYQRRTVKEYADRPAQLAARLALVGFTEVYLGMSRAMLVGEDREAEKWTLAFNAAAHRWGMKVYLLTLSGAKLWVDNRRIYDDVKLFIDFNYSQKKRERFDGVSADLEPHIMKKKHPERPKELTLEWDGTNGYGKGGDNDLLCKRMVEVLEKARKELGNGITMSQAQGFFLQGRYDKGELEWGAAEQLLRSCDWLVVMAYNYRPERVFEMAKPSLVNAAGKPKSVSIAIKTSLDTYGSEGPVTSFQPQGWDYLLRGIDWLIRESLAYPSFRGVDVFEFQGLEQMWNGTAVEDKRSNYQRSEH